MSRLISRAESWEKVYEAYSAISFATYDYDSVKKSLIEYLKLYHSETFNDFIESSEFVAILELFAYMSEIVAYRLDMNAHENFISSAQRKDSVLRLAKLISYTPSRNIPARGLVKLTSVKTSEKVYDAFGNNLSNKKIIWNDINNSDWKIQFLTVMNRVLSQEFGSVLPSERVQIDDVLFELYTLEHAPLGTNSNTPLFTYSADINGGTNLPMELVPTIFEDGVIVERRPESNSKFSLLYGTDGSGDSSATTGFFCYTKQGTLTSVSTSFDGVTPNQTYDVLSSNVNDTDVWVNNVTSPTNPAIKTDDRGTKIGEWVEVDLAHAQNIMFNTNKNRLKFEVETLSADQIRIVFGDGEFADIPSGQFQIWYRVSANGDFVIPQNAITEKTASFTYVDDQNKTQTFTFTFSSIGTIQNAAPSEDIDHIRRVAPAVYYAQDRMVNGRDYNSFPLQDPSILKLRAINRTFSGDSKYIGWHDPREYYENVKIFGDDLVVYEDESTDLDFGRRETVSSSMNANQVIVGYLEPYLSSTDFFGVISPSLEAMGVRLGSIRKVFNSSELNMISNALNNTAHAYDIINLYYSPSNDIWTLTQDYSDSILCVTIEKDYAGGPNLVGYAIKFRRRRFVAYSASTNFWNSNTTDSVITYDSMNSNMDSVVILKANADGTGTALLSAPYDFKVTAIELVSPDLPNSGLIDQHRLSLIYSDNNGDLIPDRAWFPELFSKEWTGTPSSLLSTSSPTTGKYGPTGMSYLRVQDEDAISQELEVWINNIKLTPKVAPSAGPFAFWSPDLTTRRPTHFWLYDMNSVLFSVPDTTSILEKIAGSPGAGGFKLPIAARSYISIGSKLTITGTATSVFTVKAAGVDPLDSAKFVITVSEEVLAANTYTSITNKMDIYMKSVVYFNRETLTSDWTYVETNIDNEDSWVIDLENDYKNHLWMRKHGRSGLNFAWFHYTPRYNLVDPSATNIIDMFIITRGYYNSVRDWVAGTSSVIPTPPTALDLRTAYSKLVENKMISDTVVMHPGKIKLLFGGLAIPELQATLKCIRPTSTNLSDNQFKVNIVEVVRKYFDLNNWEFGETFYFTELASFIHASLGSEIDSVVLVPKFSSNQFGDLFSVPAMEDEILYADLNVEDIEVVTAYTAANLRQ